jgi:mxaD protein
MHSSNRTTPEENRMKNRLTVAAAALALLGLLPASGALAASLHVEESTTVAAAPAAVWKIVGSFSGLAGWHPVVAETMLIDGKNNKPGAIRSIKTKDGAIIIEDLQAYDAAKRSMRYHIMESPLPVKNYVSTLSVERNGKGSRIVWKSDFDAVRSATVDDAKAQEIVAGIYKAGFDGLRAKLGEQ